MKAIYLERIRNYERLIVLSKEQEQILLGPGYSKLPENLSQFDPIILAMKKLDKKEDSIRDYLRKKQSIGELLDFELKDDKIKEMAQYAMDRALELRKITLVNTQLIDNLMKFVNFSIGIVCKVASGRSKEENGVGPAILLDMKV